MTKSKANELGLEQVESLFLSKKIRHTFNSAYGCFMFLEKHDVNDWIIKMFDIMSLLQAACFGNEGTKESLDFDLKASKSSYKSTATNFGLWCPSLFSALVLCCSSPCLKKLSTLISTPFWVDREELLPLARKQA